MRCPPCPRASARRPPCAAPSRLRAPPAALSRLRGAPAALLILPLSFPSPSHPPAPACAEITYLEVASFDRVPPKRSAVVPLPPAALLSNLPSLRNKNGQEGRARGGRRPAKKKGPERGVARRKARQGTPASRAPRRDAPSISRAPAPRGFAPLAERTSGPSQLASDAAPPSSFCSWPSQSSPTCRKCALLPPARAAFAARSSARAPPCAPWPFLRDGNGGRRRPTGNVGGERGCRTRALGSTHADRIASRRTSRRSRRIGPRRSNEPDPFTLLELGDTRLMAESSERRAPAAFVRSPTEAPDSHREASPRSETCGIRGPGALARPEPRGWHHNEHRSRTRSGPRRALRRESWPPTRQRWGRGGGWTAPRDALTAGAKTVLRPRRARRNDERRRARRGESGRGGRRRDRQKEERGRPTIASPNERGRLSADIAPRADALATRTKPWSAQAISHLFVRLYRRRMSLNLAPNGFLGRIFVGREDRSGRRSARRAARGGQRQPASKAACFHPGSGRKLADARGARDAASERGCVGGRRMPGRREVPKRPASTRAEGGAWREASAASRDELELGGLWRRPTRARAGTRRGSRRSSRGGCTAASRRSGSAETRRAGPGRAPPKRGATGPREDNARGTAVGRDAADRERRGASRRAGR